MRILRAADPDPDIRDFLLEFISSDRSSYGDDVLAYMDINFHSLAIDSIDVTRRVLLVH